MNSFLLLPCEIHLYLGGTVDMKKNESDTEITSLLKKTSTDHEYWFKNGFSQNQHKLRPLITLSPNSDKDIRKARSKVS